MRRFVGIDWMRQCQMIQKGNFIYSANPFLFHIPVLLYPSHLFFIPGKLWGENCQVPNLTVSLFSPKFFHISHNFRRRSLGQILNFERHCCGWRRRRQGLESHTMTGKKWAEQKKEFLLPARQLMDNSNVYSEQPFIKCPSKHTQAHSSGNSLRKFNLIALVIQVSKVHNGTFCVLGGKCLSQGAIKESDAPITIGRVLLKGHLMTITRFNILSADTIYHYWLSNKF